MPSQQVEIAEAIAGIKRALKREREGIAILSHLTWLRGQRTDGAPPHPAPSDQPVVAASNRGNKLRKGAKFVHEGSLLHVTGPEIYKQNIEHAGYTRYILDRNPRRYNEYGEELEDSETDEEADADAADQNAYSGIHLEELLCPLKHPSELPMHPTMSLAYLSAALPDMVTSTHEKLRQERANLWRAKYLNRQLIGDASWIPAGEVESPDDWKLFEPRNQGGYRQPSRKRKRRTDGHHSQNGKLEQPLEMQSERNGVSKATFKLKQDILSAPTNGADAADEVENNKALADGQGANGNATKGEKVAEADTSSSNTVIKEALEVPSKPEINGIDPILIEHNGMDEDVKQQARRPDQENERDVHPDSRADADGQAARRLSHAASDIDDTSPPPPPRRITRALTATNQSNPQSNAPTPPLSPVSSSTSTSSNSQVYIDPLYLVPQSANPSNSAMAFHGLLPEEALETRRLLTLYIQKQEESVRGYEAIVSKLLTAQRLRTEVLELCKTEEHVGELSDGEDWIDAERWGLQPGELRKGRDEDEDAMDENTIGGRKGKRRARN